MAPPTMLMICYDLNNPEKDYTEFINTIKKADSWVRVTKNSWLITDERYPDRPVLGWYLDLKGKLEETDELMVVHIKSADLLGTSDSVHRWLKKHW